MAAAVVASDHAGLDMKDALKEDLVALGFDVVDLGTNATDSVDYPAFRARAAAAIRDGEAEMGLIVCGSGIGISMSANREPAARAALCHDVTTARLSRLHNDANILALGARVIGLETARECVAAFFSTAFEGGRHQRRVDMLGAETSDT